MKPATVGCLMAGLVAAVFVAIACFMAVMLVVKIVTAT